jgi:hypothetical protein
MDETQPPPTPGDDIVASLHITASGDTRMEYWPTQIGHQEAVEAIIAAARSTIADPDDPDYDQQQRRQTILVHVEAACRACDTIKAHIVGWCTQDTCYRTFPLTETAEHLETDPDNITAGAFLLGTGRPGNPHHPDVAITGFAPEPPTENEES